MAEQELWLDGNAIAGLLEEILGAEMTAAPRDCQSCGSRHPIGAHRLYRGVGLVLRCPSCDAVAMILSTLPDRHVVEFAGTWRVEILN